jgi:hypothetical protein
MCLKGAVIGLPIQFLSRISGVVGTKAGAAITAVTTAGLTLGAMAPYVSNFPLTGTKLQSEEYTDETTVGMGLRSLVTFMDLNAEVMTMDEKRRIAVIDIPGREGDYIQTMGGKSRVYYLKGHFFDLDSFVPGLQASPLSYIFQQLTGDAAVGNVQLLTQLERLDIPVPFLSRMEISEVLIWRTKFTDKGGRPNRIAYELFLIEYRRLPILGKLGTLAFQNIATRLK